MSSTKPDPLYESFPIYCYNFFSSECLDKVQLTFVNSKLQNSLHLSKAVSDKSSIDYSDRKTNIPAHSGKTDETQENFPKNPNQRSLTPSSTKTMTFSQVDKIFSKTPRSKANRIGIGIPDACTYPTYRASQ